ncbi:MAG: asparagine synthase (glutamine-hydrolyzing) [Ectothiorhodospiraceae bacterium]|nr:asparagine synthase (glutamine-hydrolyzing) [Ectothiorhodospiraceae bacterium]
MCGIAGILNLRADYPVTREELEPMVGRLHHRGPDAHGFHCDGGLGLGHARLSIIDPAGGGQPMAGPAGDCWIAFNGEIFNYLELRADLIARGHRFRTRSDTEVILHLYQAHGDDFVHHLNGQFAIALWDARRRRLLLVRDRVGILPLFYTEQRGRLLFASEVKALLPAFDAAPALDPEALDEIMTFWAAQAPRTPFRGVRQLRPGEMLIAEHGGLHTRRYWDWLYPPEGGDYLNGSDDALAGQLRELLEDATRIRLRADVPVGAYLSGGLDSSALVGMIQAGGITALRTFSIGFQDQDLDETGFQQQVIRHVGADHSRVQCRAQDVGAAFPETVFHAESPVLRTAPVPMRLLSGLVRRQGFKVVLTGEGADEVLGGYDLFKEGKIRQFWAAQAGSAWRPLLLKRLYPYLNITRGQGLEYLKRFFGTGLDDPRSPFFSHLTRWQSTAQCKLFFSDGLQATLRDGGSDPIARLRQSLPPELDGWHPFHKAQYVEARTLMAAYLLCSQGDRMLMANSVEGRFPFLDHRVIAFANRLHPRMKMRALNEKFLLKRAMRGLVPEPVLSRHKQPYRAPDIPAFFSDGAGADYVEELLSPEVLHRYGYFHPARVQRLVEKIRRGRAIGNKDNMALVGILSTQLWHYHFVENHHRNFHGVTEGAVGRP